MNSRTQKISSAIALFLIFSISQVYVQANLAGSKAVSKDAATSALAGKLVSRTPILLNGNETDSAATVLSGATLETPEGTTASVLLGSLGKVDIAPQTTLTLNFNKENVEIALTSGSVTLTTSKGINGAVSTAKEIVRTDSSKLSSVTVNSDDKDKKTGNAEPQGGGAGGGGSQGGGMSTKKGAIIGGAGIAGAILAAIYVPCRRGRNPSPGTPRGRNDECRHGF